MSRSGAHEAFHDHRLDLLIRELTRPSDPLRIDVQLMPARIVLAGLEMYRVMPGLPPGAEIIELPDMPECSIEPPLYGGDPMEADADDHDAWLDQTILDGDL